MGDTITFPKLERHIVCLADFVLFFETNPYSVLWSLTTKQESKLSCRLQECKQNKFPFWAAFSFVNTTISYSYEWCLWAEENSESDNKHVRFAISWVEVGQFVSDSQFQRLSVGQSKMPSSQFQRISRWFCGLSSWRRREFAWRKWPSRQRRFPQKQSKAAEIFMESLCHIFCLAQTPINSLWRVWSWLRVNAGGVPNTCKSNDEAFSLLEVD